MSPKPSDSALYNGQVRWLVALPASLVLAGGLWAHQYIETALSWNEQISRIIYKRCYSCHREGGIAPMSFATYREVRPWAKAIKHEVLNRRMPPWGPVKGYGAFRHDASLTQEEIAMLSSWAEGGAPAGSPIFAADLPADEELTPPPVYEAPAMPINDGVTLSDPVLAGGIHVGGLAEGAQVQFWAVRPDGSVAHLVWLRDFAERWNRAYQFREPIELPAGTRFGQYPADAGSAVLLLAPTP